MWLTSPPTGANLLEVLLETPTVESYLEELATMAEHLNSAIMGCGVTLRRHGDVLSVATSSPAVAALDDAQYADRAGPCLEALDTGQVLTVADVLDEQRWTGFRRRALDARVRSSLAVPLKVGGVTVGALNCYAAEPGLFVDSVRAQVVLFATHAQTALELVLRSVQGSEIAEQLHVAMQSRSVIDQALGIIMAQQRCTAQDAFSVLRTASQSRNRKVADIAAGLVTTISGHAPQPGKFEP